MKYPKTALWYSAGRVLLIWRCWRMRWIRFMGVRERVWGNVRGSADLKVTVESLAYWRIILI
jgi:hypothetical protein